MKQNRTRFRFRFNPTSNYIKQQTLSWCMMGGKIEVYPADTRRNSLYIHSSVLGVRAYEDLDHVIFPGVSL